MTEKRKGSISGLNYFEGEHDGSHLEHGFMPTGRRGSAVVKVIDEPNVVHVPDDIMRRTSAVNPDFGGLAADSKDATNYETSMAIGTAFKLYRKGVMWSLLMSTAIIMEGYDTILLGNFYGLPAFAAKFGNEYDATATPPGPTVGAPWRAGLSNGAQIGEILGLMATGIVQDRYGYKKTIGGAMTAIVGLLFILFFAKDLPMLLAGEILCGLCWGVFQTITTAYASEVTPVVLRPYLTTYVNLCWVIGQLIASGVLRGMLSEGKSQWGWRIPYALQWVWPIPIIVGCILAPESPWWLVRHGRYEDAKRALLRLTTPSADPSFNPDQTIAMMEHTNEIEKEISSGTSYFDCFKGTDLRRTEIVCITWLVQTLCGSTFMGYSTVFYEQAGLAENHAFDMSIGQFSLGVLGTVSSWFAMTWFGRRTLYLYGSAFLCLLLIIIGCLGTRQNEASADWAIGSMLLIFTFVYDFTVGPVCYSLVAELSSTRLKAKTIVLSRNLYNIGGIIVNVITNYQLTPTAWDWRAYSGFFWAGTCFFCVVWVFFRLPEPKNRTYGELDLLFEAKIPARKFKSTKVDIFRGDTVSVLDADQAARMEAAKFDGYKLGAGDEEKT